MFNEPDRRVNAELYMWRSDDIGISQENLIIETNVPADYQGKKQLTRTKIESEVKYE